MGAGAAAAAGPLSFSIALRSIVLMLIAVFPSKYCYCSSDSATVVPVEVVAASIVVCLRLCLCLCRLVVGAIQCQAARLQSVPSSFFPPNRWCCPMPRQHEQNGQLYPYIPKPLNSNIAYGGSKRRW